MWTGNNFLDYVAVAVALVTITIVFFKWKFTYWERRGLQCLNPVIPFGDIKDVILGRSPTSELNRKLYRDARDRNLRHVGLYVSYRPNYMPVDPQIVKLIMQNDFAHFPNHGGYINEDADPLTGHLFNLRDEKWKTLRAKLTPTFTSGKMKMMFNTMTDCAANLGEVIDQLALKKEPVEIDDTLQRFTADIIGSAAFGLDCNSLKDPNAEFHKYGKKNFEVDVWMLLKIIALVFVPERILKFFKYRFIPKDVDRFYRTVVTDTVKYREKNNVYRKDFMHLLLQLKNRGKVSDDEKIISEDGAKVQGITMNELTAQAYIFFIAGFETSSTTMTWALMELARNPEIQDKVRHEINAVLKKHDNQLTYDAAMEMNYLDQIISETLRKYPPLAVLDRLCVKDYNVPGTEVIIEKGTRVSIPVLAIQNDPEYFPEPEKFDPDRFTEENKSKRLPFTWFPFGEGPRICIGLRFGVLQTKVGLATILKNHRIILNEKTILPVKFKNSFITNIKGGVWLNIEQVTD